MKEELNNKKDFEEETHMFSNFNNLDYINKKDRGN